NLFPPLDNPEITIQRRSRTDLTLLNDSEMAAEGPGDLPVPDIQTMEELCQPSLNGRGGPIALIAIHETNFGLKNYMIQQVQNSCQFHGLSDDALRLYLFPRSLTHHSTAWFDRLPRNSINTSKQMAKMFLAIVGNTQNVYATGAYQGNSYQPQGNRNLLSYRLDNYLGPPGFNQNQNRNNQNQNFHNQNRNKGNHNPQGNNQGRNQFFQGANQGNTITNPKEDLKGITTHSGIAYQGPTIPTTSSSPVVERETEATKNTVHPTNNGNTEDVQPLVFPTESQILNSERVISPIIEPVTSPVSASRPNQRPLIPYPSRLHDQKLRDKANDQREKFFQISKDLNFNISFADALILMPKFGPSIKSLLTNKDKLCELARTLLNEHFSVVLLKKLPKKLGDPSKFLISCDFPRMAECLALADLDASINLMPLSLWNKISLPNFSPTCMTLELADRSISHPVRVAEYVRQSRSFLKTRRALIYVFEGELTLRVRKEAITFNLNQTSRYLANYNDMTANQIDVIDMGCEEYSQEVLSFFDVIASGNPTPYYDLIVSTISLTLTAFGNRNHLPQVRKELKIYEAKSDKSSIDEPPDFELKDLPSYLKYAFLEGDDKFPVIIAKDLSVEEKTALITVLTSHKRAIAWKLSNIKEAIVLGHKISKNGIEVDKAKVDIIAKLPHPTTVKGIHSFLGHASFYRSDFAIDAVLGQRQEKHFRPIHYASKTMIEVLLLQDFTFKVIETKRAENLAADHLSRLENPHQNVLDPKEINKSFPLETLNLVSSRGNL
nr:reverse transcriptase domain-containing protein [Tanacetum cinerariifolium]